MVRRVAIVALIAGAVFPAAALGAIFLTPSGNISCTTPALKQSTGVSCTVFSESSSAGQKVWQIRRHGRATTYHLRSNAASEGRTLRYGQTYKGHGIRCRSAASGLRCTNRDGHGFKLSREHQRIF